ncbi:MAG: hypothetical protein EA408_12305 [Marinilabiliales bacterium]|nr:MAG: hypothetical protein EA408_12305 [Marinilabiliales bacterium]
MLWLEEAGLVYRVFSVTKPAVPLTAYRDIASFKLCALEEFLRLAVISKAVALFWTKVKARVHNGQLDRGLSGRLSFIILMFSQRLPEMKLFVALFDKKVCWIK